MPRTPEAKGHKSSKQLAAIDQLLMSGINLGPAKKRDAIKKILELAPGWTREDCWRRIKELRKTPECVRLAAPKEPTGARKTGTKARRKA